MEAAPRDPTLTRYLEAMLAKNQSLNLTSVQDFEEAWRVHVEDSRAVERLSLNPPPRRIADLGSGNGFPGVVVALRYPKAEVILVERTQKKARAIQELCADCGISNISVEACDGRELIARRPECRGGVDLVTARAVGSLEAILKVVAPWLSRDGRIALWKSRALTDDERAAGERAARKGKLRPEPAIPYDVPGARAGQLIVYARARPPRGRRR